MKLWKYSGVFVPIKVRKCNVNIMQYISSFHCYIWPVLYLAFYVVCSVMFVISQNKLVSGDWATEFFAQCMLFWQNVRWSAILISVHILQENKISNAFLNIFVSILSFLYPVSPFAFVSFVFHFQTSRNVSLEIKSPQTIIVLGTRLC